MQMRKKNIIYTLALVGMLILFNSCKKEYESIESIDDAKIQTYIKQKNLNMTKDPSGFYYQIITQGTGDVILDKDSVLYDFDLKSLDGTLFQSANSLGNNGNYLGYVTPSPFRIAMLNLKRGGAAKIIIPSHLAFGKNGNGNIPSNEIILTDLSVYNQKSQIQLDDDRINAFLTAKGITAIKDPSRVYYKVLTPGTGTEAIDMHSTVVFSYTGRLLNGTVFDSGTGFSTTLPYVIQGWQKIIPKFTNGAKIRIFIPSDLAYGGAGSTGIPMNAPLDFDIEITSVTN
jgi:FKBP-type peptidyl-prolyl cis-trans isomerase FkpA